MPDLSMLHAERRGVPNPSPPGCKLPTPWSLEVSDADGPVGNVGERALIVRGVAAPRAG